MFVVGLLLLALALAGAVAAALAPDGGAHAGVLTAGLGVALGCGISGALLVYLDAPRRRAKAPAGMLRAKATILDATGTAGAVAGYQMIELTLEVAPKDGMPFQVKRKFSAGRLGRAEQGRRLDVLYDPANPQRVELI
jgi:hypothetical protein